MASPASRADEWVETRRVNARSPRRRTGTVSGSAYRFSHLHLENWRNFRHADVSLQRRSFLFGPNASGKSNLLDAFRFLNEIVSVGGGFEEAVAKRGGVSKIRCLAARQKPDIAIGVKVSDNGTDVWEYELHFAQDNQSQPRIKKERVVRNGRQIVARPNADDKRDPEQLRQTHLEQVRVNQSFRDLANFFRSVRYLHVVPQLVRDPDRYRGREDDPFGWDLVEKVTSTPKRTREARLNRIRDALRVAVPQLKELELWYDSRHIPHLRGRYEHWRAQGAWQTEEAFSDGTLRLLGLLWSVLDGSGPLLLEEPEMSLHPEVVRYIPQMLARMQQRTGRQVMISSHSSDLLRDDGIGLDEVLLLRPAAEGTGVQPAGSNAETKLLLEAGAMLDEIIIPRTRPTSPEQLSLFGK